MSTTDGKELSFDNKVKIVKTVSKYKILCEKFDADTDISKKEKALDKVVKLLGTSDIILTKKDLSKFLYRLRYKIRSKVDTDLNDYELVYKKFINKGKLQQERAAKKNTISNKIVKVKIEKGNDSTINISGNSCLKEMFTQTNRHLQNPKNDFTEIKNSTPFTVKPNNTESNLGGKSLNSTKAKKTPKNTKSAKDITKDSGRKKKTVPHSKVAKEKRSSSNDEDEENLQAMSTKELKRLLLVENITLSSLKKKFYEKKSQLLGKTKTVKI